MRNSMIFNGPVGGKQRIGKKFFRPDDSRLGLPLKAGKGDSDRNFSGNFALQMPAHAIGENEKRRLSAIGVSDTVLIDLPATEKTVLEYCKAHVESPSLILPQLAE